MKKYLSLLGVLALGGTGSLTVVACGPNNTTPNPDPELGNEKQWSNQTSNIAKSIILSKNGNFNTNRLLNNALNKNTNNIQNNSNDKTGESYENFKNIWGYKQNIEGLTEQDFINDSAETSDNAKIATKNEIKNTLDDMQQTFSLIAGLSDSFKSNKTLSGLLNGIIKGLIEGTMWELSTTLKTDSSIIDTIHYYAPMIETIVSNLDAFNPETTMGEYYDSNSIANSLFGENNDNGWIHNYKTFAGFSSEAVAKESTILNQENFKTWDQVALLKSSIDLNGLIYQWSGNKLTLGEIFNNSIKYDEKTGAAISFDMTEFANQIEAIWSTNPENIINLISVLIPVVKTQVLGLDPTTAINKISTSEPTDKEKGILNLTDIISTIEDIFLSKEGFTNFLADIFFPETNGAFKLGNYITFDFTCGNKTLSETILPIKDNVIKELGNLYTNTLNPLIEQFGIKEICANFKEILASLAPDKSADINLSDIKIISSILNGPDVYRFLNKLKDYESKADLSTDWMNLWSILGLQDASEPDFIKDSTFDKFATILKNNPDFLRKIGVIVFDIANPLIANSIDTIVEKETTTGLDFENKNLWSTSEIKYTYDKNVDETTLSYDLIDLTNNKTYKVTVVILGTMDQELGTTKTQVWLKSLTEVN